MMERSTKMAELDIGEVLACEGSVGSVKLPLQRMRSYAMRTITVACLAVLATPAMAAFGDPSHPVMANTPSGLGDPNAIVCRAPQPLAGSGQMGPQICMHNNVWARLSLTGQDLAADGKSVFARPTVDQPTGEGNPDSVTCRTPVPLTASRTRRGPEVCLTNGQWKDIAAKQLRVNEAGVVVSARQTGPGANGAIPILSVDRSPAL
jgi:hypothetical protein